MHVSLPPPRSPLSSQRRREFCIYSIFSPWAPDQRCPSEEDWAIDSPHHPALRPSYLLPGASTPHHLFGSPCKHWPFLVFASLGWKEAVHPSSSIGASAEPVRSLQGGARVRPGWVPSLGRSQAEGPRCASSSSHQFACWDLLIRDEGQATMKTFRLREQGSISIFLCF